MKAKLTGWLDGSDKPVRVGVYRRDDRRTSCHDGKPSFSHWGGWKWGHLCADADSAERFSDTTSEYQNLPWRGLASDPKASKP